MKEIDKELTTKGVIRDIHFANALIKKALDEKRPITHLHLQKLMYFAYGHMLAIHNVSIGNTKFQPWTMGPVVVNIYFIMRGFGPRPITEYCTEFDPASACLISRWISKNNTKFHTTLDQVWTKYRHLSVRELIDRSHRDGGAWEKAYKKEMYLSDRDIKKEFKELIKAESQPK